MALTAGTLTAPEASAATSTPGPPKPVFTPLTVPTSAKPVPVTAQQTQDPGQPDDSRHRTISKIKADSQARVLVPKKPPVLPVDPAQQKEIDKLNALRSTGRLAPSRAAVPGSPGPSLQAIPQKVIDPDPTIPLGTATKATRSPAAGLASPQAGQAAPRYGAGYIVSTTFQVNPSYSTDGVIRVRVSNTGSATWDNTFALGSHVYRADGSAYSYNGATTNPDWRIPPGYYIDVDAFVQPLPAGTFSVVFDMIEFNLANGSPYFSEKGVPASQAIRFTVPHYAPTAELSAPLGDATVDTLRPSLSINLRSDQTKPTDANFQVCPTEDASSGCTDSGWRSVPTYGDVFVVNASWTVPPGAIARWNEPSYWRVRVRDTTATTPWSATSRFVPTVAQPTEYGAGADPAAADGAGVGLFAGNYTRTENDLALPVPEGGVPLGVSRVYNSSGTRSGAFGIAWSSLLDVSLTLRQNSSGENMATIGFPDGHQTQYGQNSDGSWTPSVGESTEQSFVSQGADQHLDLGDGTRYVFASTSTAGLYVLGQIVGPSGGALRFIQSGGHISQLTDSRSGRSIYLTWTGAQVTSASTAPAGTSGVVVWGYTYTGGTLTKSCDGEPAPKCTTYAYGQSAPLPRLVSITRANTANVTTIDYNGLYVARVGDARNSAGQYPNSWTYSREVIDPAGNPYADALIVSVVDPNGIRLTYRFNQLGLLASRSVGDSVTGPERIYFYDYQGRLSALIDENGNDTEYQWDLDSGALQVLTRHRDDAAMVQVNSTYVGSADPAHRSLPLTVRDANGNTTTMTYRGGLLATRTTPPTASAPSGARTTYAYTCDGGAPAPSPVNDSAAVQGQLQPCGLLASVTGPDALVTRFAYDHYGDRTQQIMPTGLRIDDTFDSLGRMYRRTVTTPGEPDAPFTVFQYDSHGRPVSELDPAVRNPVTGQYHHRRITIGYDGDGNVLQESVSDEIGVGPPDPPRTTTYTYDSHDRPATVSRNGQVVSRTTYDGTGRLIRSIDGNGAQYDNTYNALGLLQSVTLANMVDNPSAPSTPRRVTLAQYAYDRAGRLATFQNALNHVVRYTYTGDDLLATETFVGLTSPYSPAPPTHDVLLHSNTYDPAGNIVKDVSGSGAATRTSTYTYDAVNQPTSAVSNPTTMANQSAVPRTTSWAYDPAGRPLSTTVSQSGWPAQAQKQYYDGTGQMFKSAVQNTPADLVTQYTRDGAGKVLSSTDPRGPSPGVSTAPGNTAFTSDYIYDILGRLSTTLAPPVVVQDGTGTAPTTVRPFTNIGYNIYGQPVDVTDSRGVITHTTYDNRGRRSRVDYPKSGSVQPTESWTYDNNDNILTHTDRRGAVTVFRYDTRNRPYRIELAPPVSGAAVGLIQIGYDDNNNVVSRTDPMGAVVTTAYDTMDRPGWTDQQDRVPTRTDNYSFFGYTDFGEQTSAIDSYNVGSFATYDNFGDMVTSSTSGEGTTSYRRDVGGRVGSAVDPLGRETQYGYDPAGRLTTLTHYDPASEGYADRSVYTYDPASNPATFVDPAGATWGASYDAANRLSTLTDPPTTAPAAVTRFAYDANGNRTAVTDANNNTTFQTYQEWNLPRQRVEPSTATHPAVADRTWSAAYDAAGSPTSTTEPGGVSRTATYDARGRLSTVSASGGDAGAGKNFGYDQSDRMTTAGLQQFAYNDRGLITSSNGTQGTSSFGYDNQGRLSSQTDQAGTVRYTYSGLTDVASISDDLSQTTRNFTHDPAGQVTREQDFVAGEYGPTRAWTYDHRGRVLRDSTTDTTGQVTADITNSYDINGNVATVGYGGGLSGSRTNTYDRANRLSTSTAGSNRESYTWDGAGNRTTVTSTTGSASKTTTYTYDQRNRLLSSATPGSPPVNTANTWSPRGTLQATATTTGSSTTTSTNRFDAFDRLTASGSTTYGYDALDRLATVVAGGPSGHSYAGFSKEPVSDGKWLYARTGSGSVLSERDGGTPVIKPVTNLHGDAVGSVYPETGTVADTRAYDPFGKVTGGTGTHPPVGFQGSWTDPTTGLVNAQARWYNPATGTFLSHDPSSPGITTAADTNPYLYGGANPTTYADPNGLFLVPPLPIVAAPEAAAGVAACIASLFCIGAVAAIGLAVAGIGGIVWLGSHNNSAPSQSGPAPTTNPRDGDLRPNRGTGTTQPQPQPQKNPPSPSHTQPSSPQVSANRAAAPTPPRPQPVRVTSTRASTTTTSWQTSSSWYDQDYIYTRVDHYTQTLSQQWTYFSDGGWKYQWWRSPVNDRPTVTSKPTRDLSNPIILDLPAPGPTPSTHRPHPSPRHRHLRKRRQHHHLLRQPTPSRPPPARRRPPHQHPTRRRLRPRRTTTHQPHRRHLPHRRHRNLCGYCRSNVWQYVGNSCRSGWGRPGL